MQVAHPDTIIGQVLGQVLRHALGERGDQHPLPALDGDMYLLEQVIDLGGGGPHRQRRIHQPGGAYHLFYRAAGVFLLVGAGCCRHEHSLGHQQLPLFEPQRAVVQRRGQAKAELHQGLLARAVALVHGADLGNGGVGFIDNHQRILRQVLKQGGGRFPGRPARQVTRIVFDAGAVTQLADHLHIVARALLQPLRLDQLVVFFQLFEPLRQFQLDMLHRAQGDIPRGHVMALGKDGDARHFGLHHPGQGVEQADAVDLLIEQFDAHRVTL